MYGKKKKKKKSKSKKLDTNFIKEWKYLVAKIKNKRNIFTTPQDLKEWSMDLAEACGSILINKTKYQQD